MRRPLLVAGLVDALAFAPSVIVLGAIFGASSGQAQIGPAAAVLMSALVFSGAGQFAALPLWAGGGPVIVLSTLALSLRFALISTSLAPMLAGRSRVVRAALAYTLTDENYALAVTRRAGSLAPSYLVGSWLVLYGGWVLGTALGVVLGAQVPSAWVGPLSAVFPLVFLVLTVLLCTSVPLALVAVLGAVISVVGAHSLPDGWNIVVAGFVASLAGVPLECLGRRAAPGA